MMKPYTKQKLFSKRSSAQNKPGSSFASGEVPLAYLNRLAVFETLRAYGGRIFHWEEHYERFCSSCRAIHENPPFKAEELKAWLDAELRTSGYPDASLRVAAHWEDKGEGRLVLFIRPFTSHPREWYEKGVSLRTSVSRRWTLKAQDPQIKSSQYVSGVLAYLDNGALEAHELLFFGSGGTVAEGTVSNLFIVKGKRLLTPSTGSGILKGVTRSVALGLARKRGWPVSETELTRHDFYSAQECFLTNTSSEVLPIVKLDGRLIGDGKPGPLTRALGDDFKKMIL